MAEERMPLVLNAADGTSPAARYGGAPSWKTVALATYYTLVVCLGGLQFGLVIVFSSPLLDDFQTNLPANFTVWSGFNQCTYQDLAGPIAPAGAVLGSIISSPVVALTGFVTGLVVMSSLFLSGWLLMAVSYFTYHGGAWPAVWFRGVLFLGRLLTGVGAGWAAGVVPVYIGEVSPPSVRGTLGALFQMSICTGVLLSYLIGTYISYWKLAFVCTAISAVQIVMTFTIRESPRISRNPLKNISALFAKRRDDTRQAAHTSNVTMYAKTASPWSASIKSNFLRIVIVSIIMFFQQFVGVNAIATFAGPIFHAAGLDKGNLSSGLLATLSVGLVQMVFITLSLFVVDRFGRRIPLFIGGLALMVANMGIAVYFAVSFGVIPSGSGHYSSTRNVNTSSIQDCVSVPLEPSPLAAQLSPLPIASVCFYFAVFSLSWGPVPWVIGGEMFPDQIREVGMGISAAVNWLCIVLVMSTFPVISARIGQTIPFLFFAAFSFLSSVFVVLFLAETKGLRLDQISSMQITNMRKNVHEFGLLLRWLVSCGFVRRIELPHFQG